MAYLEAFISENLRLHPPVVLSVRTCSKDCEVNIYIAHKVKIILPITMKVWPLRYSTDLRKSLCMWLRECRRQVEAEVVSNSRNKLHQTTYKDFFSAL